MSRRITRAIIAACAKAGACRAGLAWVGILCLAEELT